MTEPLRLAVLTGTRAEYGLFRPLLAALDAEPGFATSLHRHRRAPRAALRRHRRRDRGRRPPHRGARAAAARRRRRARRRAGRGRRPVGHRRGARRRAARPAHRARRPLRDAGRRLGRPARPRAGRPPARRRALAGRDRRRHAPRRQQDGVAALPRHGRRGAAPRPARRGTGPCLRGRRARRRQRAARAAPEQGRARGRARPAVRAGHGARRPSTPSRSRPAAPPSSTSCSPRSTSGPTSRPCSPCPTPTPATAPWRRRSRTTAQAHADRARAFASLGARRYLSLLAQVDVCLGNSSSGIIEAPALGTPSVDVGARQAGRERAASVLHCEPQAADIAAALQRALSPELQDLAQTCDNPYGDGHAAERIVGVLRRELPLPAPLIKRFHDLPGEAAPAPARRADVFDGRRVLALIPARGGSKGLPGKNVAPLGGRPLIAWTIAAARGCAAVDEVVVSTDDDAIAQRPHGGRRPRALPPPGRPGRRRGAHGRRHRPRPGDAGRQRPPTAGCCSCNPPRRCAPPPTSTRPSPA